LSAFSDAAFAVCAASVRQHSAIPCGGPVLFIACAFYFVLAKERGRGVRVSGTARKYFRIVYGDSSFILLPEGLRRSVRLPPPDRRSMSLRLSPGHVEVDMGDEPGPLFGKFDPARA
jgi:hypothetical protein